MASPNGTSSSDGRRNSPPYRQVPMSLQQRRGSEPDSILSFGSGSGSSGGGGLRRASTHRVKELFGRSRSRSQADILSVSEPSPSSSQDGGERPLEGSVKLRPGGSVRLSPRLRNEVPRPFRSDIPRRDTLDGYEDAGQAIEELAETHDPPKSGPFPSIRRVSSKVFVNPFSSSSPSPSPTTSSFPQSSLSAPPERSRPDTLTPPPRIVRPPSPARVSSTYSDFDPICPSDADSFEDDGREGSLQDALEGIEDSPRADSVPDGSAEPVVVERRTPGRRRGRARLKEARPGKQHGAGFFPSSPPQSVASRGHRTRRSLDLQIPSPTRRQHLAAPGAPPQPSPSLSVTSSNPNSGLQGRLGGWISHAFSASASHLPLPSASTAEGPPDDGTRSVSGSSIFRRSPDAAPRESFLTRRKSKDLLNSPPTPSSSTSGISKKHATAPASQGRALGNFLDKAVNYLFDTDAHAYDTRLTEDIWMMGGQRFDGVWNWDASPTIPSLGLPETRVERAGSTGGSASESGGVGRRRLGRKGVKGRHLFRNKRTGSEESIPPRERPSGSWSPSPSPSSEVSERPPLTVHNLPATLTHSYPPPFYVAFASILGLTYRADFPPIPCAPERLRGNGISGVLNSISMSLGRGSKKDIFPPRVPSPATVANLAAGLSVTDDPRGLTSDAGWGCMLRTGQSLLANALLVAHLGRDWRRPLASIADPLHDAPLDPTYARLVSWFIDSPSQLAPFSVHRFALKGKELGKEVGEWFGPSTAAGAIKSLANDFAPAGLGVVTDVDGSLYGSDVLDASRTTSRTGQNRSQHPASYWQRPVLVLSNLRLGIDGVHPSYHGSIKALFQLPQSVGIAGGRPSSSYYFFGYQGDSLFYIDPHHPRPAISMIDVPPPLATAAESATLPFRALDNDWEHVSTDSSPSERSSDLDTFFARAYPDSALRTFHTERIRRMAIAGMDPSMLVGFLIRDGDDWEDFCIRVRALKPPLLHIAETTPSWMRDHVEQQPSDSDLGVDSMSEADDSESDESRERWPSEEPETRPTSVESPPFTLVRSETARPLVEPRSRNISAATVRADEMAESGMTVVEGCTS